MAEDDTFGEFAFSSYHSNPPATLHSQSNGLNTFAAAADDDNEWGDFVKSPQQSQTLDPPFHSLVGKGNSPSHYLASPSRWVKPSGALPLSIFGDAEEEDDKDSKDFNQRRSNAIAGDFNSNFADNNVSNSKNLSIANLYSRTSQIKPENGPDSNSTSRFDLMANDSRSVENGFHSSSNQNVARSDFSEWKNVGFDGVVGRRDQCQFIKNENNEFSQNSNVLNLTQNAGLFGEWTLDFNGFNYNSNAVNPSVKSSSSNLDMNGGKQELNVVATATHDDGDDGWEFKDAYSESWTGDVNDKQSRGNSALSGEDASIVALDSEFQLVYKELDRMNYLFEEHDRQDHPSGNSCLNEFVELLREPQFHILESEYHLSEKLLLVGKDMKSAMELIRHATTMLKILTIGTLEEQTTYISIWSDMISICAQELKHGASIWNQAAEKHVQSQLLAETQGRNFVLALGEIYRVVVVLGASAKLFKPWTISCSVDSSGINNLLQECHALWSTSGLEEALSSVSVPTTLDDASLFKSIKDIHGLDAVALENYVFTEKDSLCRLSMLTAGVAPGMKMIMWGEEKCFVTLANLWANLKSCNPPNMPRLHIG